MIALYKHFKSLGIVFCAVLLLAAPAVAQNLTVEGVTVDVTAKNAVEARTKALDEAQVKAYRALLEQNLGADQAATIPDLDPLTIGTFVKDFEVTNEQISPTRYKGTYTVRFRANVLNQYMSSDVASPPMIDDSGMYPRPAGDPAIVNPQTTQKTLILPFFQNATQTVLWEGNNPFRMAWSRVAAFQEPSLILPLGDLTDMNNLKDREAFTFSGDAMVRLLSRYGAGQAAIVMATPNPMRGLDVHIYLSEQGGKPRFIRTIQIMPESAGQPMAVLFDRAVMQSRPLLVSLAKNAPMTPQATATVQSIQQTAPPELPAGPAQTYQGVVYFSSAQEWVKLKNTLERVPGMRGIIIKGMTPRMATLDMNFAGDPELLSVALGQAGVTLKPPVSDKKTFELRDVSSSQY